MMQLFGRRLTLALALTTLAGVRAQSVRAQQPEPVAGQEQEPTVTLEQAVELALQHSPTLAQRSGAVRTSESGERTAWGAFIPSLSFSTGASLASTERFNPTTNTSVKGSSDSYSAGLSSSVDLYTGGRRGAELRQARAQTTAAEAAALEERFAVTLQAKTAFFEVLRGDELIRVAQASIERAQAGLRAAEQRLAVGSATRSDSLRSRLEVNQAQQALLQAQNQRRSAAFALGRLVGVTGPVSAKLETSLEPSPLALTQEELADLVIQQSPTVRSAESTVSADEASLRATHAQYFPSLRLSGGYDWFNQNAAFNGGRMSWSTRLSLSYPIFNGFSREDANQRAEVTLSVSRMQLSDAQRQARANLATYLDAVQLAEQQITLAEEAVAVATEDLRVQDERYRLGAATILDQITSQIALATAEQDLINARYDYQIARAQLEALVGREL